MTDDPPREYRVVAFLQNCWFRPGTTHHVINLYLTSQSYRRRVLAMSMSGQRLARAFGAHYRNIWWDNASQYVADHSAGKSAADPVHMAAVLQQVRPLGIVCFGKIAAQGMEELQHQKLNETGMPFLPEGVLWHYSHHPNARGITQFQLDQFAQEIIARYLVIP